ncbi:MAG: response regulator transcription factor [Paludibacteraceae bacterium]|nr:response regulator transcription factor [Paludibacteraceae bacterium]
MYNIIVVDDHLLFRESIKLLIEKEGLGKVIAEAGNGIELLELLQYEHPDLVIMDIDMPYMNGLEATKKAILQYPGLKVLLLTMMSEYINFAEIRQWGAIGHILKSSGKREFEKTIRAIVEQKEELYR